MRAMSTRSRSRCSSSKSWIHAAPPSGQAISYGRSEMTRRPKFSSIGSRSEIGTGSPSLTIFRCTRSGLLVRGAMQIQPQRLRVRAQRFEVGEIVERVGRIDVVLVGEREGAAVAARRARARSLRRCALRRAPRAADRSTSWRRRRCAARWRRRSTLRRVFAIRAHHDVQARVVRVRDLHLRLDVTCPRSPRARSARCAGALRCCTGRAARR